MYIQGGSSTLSDESKGTMTLTMNEVIPYLVLGDTNRINRMPMEETPPYELPLDAALVLNGEEGESVYPIKTESWSFDAEKMDLRSGLNHLSFAKVKDWKNSPKQNRTSPKKR
jgi:hypothetical protein